MRKIWVVVLAGLFIASGAHAQEQGATGTSGTVFRSGVDVIALSVVVTDPQGKFVTGLAVDDFTVVEDGVPQSVAFFASTPVPIDLSVLLDTSASMTDKIQTVQQAAVGFTSSIRDGDRISVVGIKDAVRVLHPLNEDVGAARAAINSTKASGNTSLYNALYLSLREMTRHRLPEGEIRRQAIVVLSDGDDTTSLVGFDDVMELAKRSGVAVYTITLRSPYIVRGAFDPGGTTRAEFAMKALAQETGARAFFPATIKELAGVYGMIADELANQYFLGYTSTNTRMNGTYRRVAVRVDHPGVRTRTRSGYFAVDPSSIARR